MGLLDELKKYVKDALPGGLLNPEVTSQGILDGAALSTTAVPVLGDLLGLGADLNRYKNEPESRTIGNFALSGLGMLPFVPAMTAWHGSPHKFDKFSLDKIGTGEGAQAYGHGLYLAESPEVANQYLRAGKDVGFANFDNPQTLAGKALAQAAGDQKKAIEILNTLEQNTIGKSMKNNAYFAREVLNEGRAAANLYKTDIPDEAVARFLDWDKPLSQQESVLSALSKIDFPKKEYVLGVPDAWTGEGLHNLISEEIRRKTYLSGKDPRIDAASLLKDAGIPGIRYLDGGSRSAGQGSSNFVAFDPEMIRIIERNGQATGLEPWKPGEYTGLLK